MGHGRILFSALCAGLLAISAALSGLSAQEPEGELKQIELTEAHVKNLIAAQPDLAAVVTRLEEMPEDAEVSVKGDLDNIAKKHGFADFEDLDTVSANVQLVLDGIDPDTGEYVDPVTSLKQELADVQADESMDAEEKKALVDELNEAIVSIPPLAHAGNVAVVRKYYKEMQAALDGEIR